MTRTLRPDDRIAHYRILRLLGAGGMGEVYLARDEKLERQVALKVLPQRLVRDDERLRRFILEAKSASSLNHPAIVTIYEIGQAPVIPGGDADDAAAPAPPAETEPQEPIHYLSMELIDGETLDETIASRRLDLRGMLACLSQAADGVAKAHAAGIIHRDLKPGNIMISRDGFAKVLDFGLAKLTERLETMSDAKASGMTSAPTAAGGRTGEGMIVGTAGYIAPEQVLGKPADQRSDIFAFGCVLYQVATGRKAFSGDSTVDMMHQILHATPQPVSEINPQIPRELRRLIGRCLAKNPDQRGQSMKDLAIELREIVEEYATLSPASGSGASSGGMAQPASGQVTPPTRPRRVGALVGAGLLIAVVGTGLALWLAGRSGSDSGRPAPRAEGGAAGTLKMASLMGHPDLAESALSADGRYLAYVTAKGGKWGLRVRQVSTGSDIEILPPQDAQLSSVVFSLDGDFLYFRSRDLKTPLYNSLFQIPSLGGAPRKRFFDVDTAPAQSPDGRQVCFMRRASTEMTETLVIGDLETGQETPLVQLVRPELFIGSPAWSPGGERIAIVKGSSESALFQVVTYEIDGGDPASRKEQPIGTADWIYFYVDDLVWLQDGSGMLLSAWARGSGPNDFALWRLTYPQGAVRRITSDPSEYWFLSLSTDGSTLACQRRETISNLWSVPADRSAAPRPITSGTSSSESVGSPRATRQGPFLFIANTGSSSQIHKASLNGAGPGAVTTTDGFVYEMEPLATGGVVYNLGLKDGRSQIWRIGLDGSDPRRITTGDFDQLGSVSPDGLQVLFRRTGKPREVWQVSAEGSDERLFMAGINGCGLFSPDGRYVFCGRAVQVEGRTRSIVVIASALDGSEVASFPSPPRMGHVAWMRNSQSMSYVDGTDGGRTIYSQPIRGGQPTVVLRIPEGRIVTHEWLPDGKRVLLLVRTDSDYSLEVARLQGFELTRLVQFPVGRIFEAALGHEGRNVAFTYGDIRKEVVLIRDFL